MTIPEDKLLKIIAPIVEGQIRSFINDHPSVAEGVNWKFSHKNKADALISSLAKRITRDLCCDQNRARLKAVLLELGADNASDLESLSESR